MLKHYEPYYQPYSHPAQPSNLHPQQVLQRRGARMLKGSSSGVGLPLESSGDNIEDIQMQMEDFAGVIFLWVIATVAVLGVRAIQLLYRCHIRRVSVERATRYLAAAAPRLSKDDSSLMTSDEIKSMVRKMGVDAVIKSPLSALDDFFKDPHDDEVHLLPDNIDLTNNHAMLLHTVKELTRIKQALSRLGPPASNGPTSMPHAMPAQAEALRGPNFVSSAQAAAHVATRAAAASTALAAPQSHRLSHNLATTSPSHDLATTSPQSHAISPPEPHQQEEEQEEHPNLKVREHDLTCRRGGVLVDTPLMNFLREVGLPTPHDVKSLPQHTPHPHADTHLQVGLPLTLDVKTLPRHTPRPHADTHFHPNHSNSTTTPLGNSVLHDTPGHETPRATGIYSPTMAHPTRTREQYQFKDPQCFPIHEAGTVASTIPSPMPFSAHLEPPSRLRYSTTSPIYSPSSQLPQHSAMPSIRPASSMPSICRTRTQSFPSKRTAQTTRGRMAVRKAGTYERPLSAPRDVSKAGSITLDNSHGNSGMALSECHCMQTQLDEVMVERRDCRV